MDSPAPRRRDIRARLALMLVVALGGLLMFTACNDAEKTGSDATTPPSSDVSSSEANTTEETSAAPNWPACSEVWVADSDLPNRYRGCLEGGDAVRAEKQQCSSGQVLVTYAGRYYAVLGGPVNETDGLSNDADYRQALTACLA